MEALSRSAALTGYADLARSAGLDPHRILEAAGVPRLALDDPDLMIPARAVGQILEASAQRSGMEDFGLRLAEKRRLSNLGVVALIAREQPSMRHAIGVMAQYIWIQSDALSLVVEETGEVALLRTVIAPAVTPGDGTGGGRPLPHPGDAAGPGLAATACLLLPRAAARP